MFNLLCELHFWSQKDGIIVNNLDFGAFVYQERKSGLSCPIQEGKKLYCDGRGISFSLQNKRPKKLRDALAEFEEALRDNRLVRLEWKCSSVIRAVFDGGLQSYVKINLHSGDPEEFVHDKFVTGKLASNYVSDVAIYSHHAVFAFTDNQLLHAYLSKPSFSSSTIKKWNTLDVKLQNVKLSGPSGRRLDKVLSFNVTGDMILMWWKCGKDEVYPWSPHVKAEDRANVHIYSVSGSKFDLLCYYRTKFDPVCIVFSRIYHTTIYTIQQRVTDDGEVTLEWENASLECRNLQNNYSLSLPLSTHVSALSLSPREDKLLATCIDGSVLVADSYGNVTNRVRTNLIPSLASWHPDGALILIGNNKGQLQWFDSALSPATCQLVNHDANSSTLDIGCYFKYQPNLVGIHWNRRVNASSYDDHNDFLLLHFEKGPLVGVKLLRPHERKMSVDTIVYQYLSTGAYSSALNLLHTIDWEVDSELAMATLQSIVSFLMRQPLSPTTESAIEKALGFFLSPIRPIPDDIASEVVDGILDLAKRFFHMLLRYQCFDKAFRLAIDLNKKELFMDLHYYCKDLGNHVMAAAAWERADDLLESSCEDESESSCDCSESHSSSEGSSSDDVETESTKDLRKQIVPPLPILSPLECARNKLGYSSILQQHNYRRNPPNKPTVTPTNIIPNRLDSPSSPLKRSVNYYPPSTCVTDYLRQESTGSSLPNVVDNTSLIEDNCLVHHSNIPSSRAPLQFNTQLNSNNTHFNQQLNGDRLLCPKVVSGISSDQNIGIPYTLKVANVRRRHIEPSNHGNEEYMIQSPPNDWRPRDSEKRLIDPLQSCSRLHQNISPNRDFPSNSYTYDRLRHQPNGPAIPTDYSKSLRSLSSNTNYRYQFPPQPGGSKPDDDQYHHVDERNSLRNMNYGLGYGENHSCSPLKSTLTSTPDVIDVNKKTLEQPIVASAETEDGKIKVVHFGLV
ncbi:hypothetical protein GE061_010347 [Apolygus lucorum]|uniref:WD repeat-containing and planar cell polarity effector protein fritz n=1 Tax=Apolygus lucorum TaxID=248454 RepID=A0A8S9Y4T4_APOLU|nr:hypothetical protein GE061_010347 [Apolygus lucorum]